MVVEEVDISDQRKLNTLKIADDWIILWGSLEEVKKSYRYKNSQLENEC